MSAAAPYVSSPIPNVANYQGADVNAMNAYNQALAQINQQRLATMQQYGYTGHIDPTTGTVTGMGVDPHNPYGSFQQLLRSSAQTEMQDQQAAQERGLVGGLANQGVSADHYNFGGASANLGTALENALESLQGQQNDAAYTRDSALWQAEQPAAESAISSGAFDTPDFSGATVPDYGSTGTLPKTPAPGPNGPPTVKGPLGGSPARDKLVKSLLARGVAPSAWARNHPTQAVKLGISPKHNGNLKIIRQVRGR